MSNLETIIYCLNADDPYTNLALEDSIFRSLREQQQVLLLYRNRPCVVMGRFQNPWAEINFPLLQQEQLPLVRRYSGGGCVYHDYDNLNFAFLGHRAHFQVEKNMQVLCQALSSFQLTPERGEHFSLALAGRKFSGSSFKNIRNFQLHHGTLLLKADGNFIEQLFTPNWQIQETVALPSRRTTVAGLATANCQINLSSLQDAILNSYQQIFGPAQILPAPWECLQSSTLQHLRSFDWIWKETPFVTQHLHHPQFQLTVQMKKLQILACSILAPRWFPQGGSELVGMEIGGVIWQQFWENLDHSVGPSWRPLVQEMAWHFLPVSR